MEKVLKSLKKDKSRDPNGWINELFQDEVAGEDLKRSMLNLFNKIKADNYIPEFIRKADITTIYKGKGENCYLKIFRSILMRLIYIDKYPEIDQSMSDSQVGGRKGKNVRNHIWIVNGIISDVLSTKRKTPIDIQIFDYKQCFDSLWLQECMNDIYSGGLTDDKFALLHSANKSVNVAVKTPVGKTSSETIEDVVMQGDVFAPLLCSKLVDRIGQECLEDKKYNYLYKGEVEIPPLGMVDDLICIAECGFKTAMLNAYIKLKTNSKRLQFGYKKCKKMHVGKYCESFKCKCLKVDSWEETNVKNEDTNEDSIEDCWKGEEKMEEVSEDKYLGDIISNDGRNLKYQSKEK